MGTLTSAFDFTGKEINGLTLGSPVIIGDLYAWSDGALADGSVDEQGTITFADPTT